MARLRQGRANTARGASHFRRETVSRVRHAGATGQLTVRADSGFYAHAIVAVCRDAVCRDAVCRDAVCRDAVCRDAVCRDAVCRDAVCRDAVCRDAVCRDAVCRDAVCRDAVCRDKDVRCSITVRQHPRLRNIIEAIP